jgi:hypothetical protein
MPIDFAAEYATKTDDELLRIASDLKSLVPEAQDALIAALRNRRLDSPARLAEFRKEERQRLEDEKINIGDLVLFVPPGMGRRMYGKKNPAADGYDATLFIVFLWFPLIPLGTYRIQELSPESLCVLNKKALDWEQVFFIWMKAAVVVMAICLAVRLLAYLA